MAIRKLDSGPRRKLTLEKKVAFGLLMFLGVGGVVFGFQSFGANLSRPIQQQIANFYTGEEYLSRAEEDAKEMEEAKNRDSDLDGLSDYDEINVYKTSPYLDDTDSDGIPDREEVFAGLNPNCPEGEQCGSSRVSSEAADETDRVSEIAKAFGLEDVLASGEIELNSEADVQALFEKITVKELRKSLLSAGVSEEQLAEISDDDLRALFSGTVNEAGAAGSFADLIAKSQALSGAQEDSPSEEAPEETDAPEQTEPSSTDPSNSQDN